jgi:predicted P-loop ATPase
MIGEGKRLHKMGLAIHWLKANSKQPLESGWTKGKRKSWQELEDTYRYGFNIGVRLGQASKFKDGTFLAVIDCDVKSEDPKHLKEMEAKLSELVKTKAPQVASGRGNGSRHIYIRTKSPIQPYRFCQSAHKVRVLMPSVKPSRLEEQTLSKADLKEGWRLRAAWEISVMGEGQQVVLPPSIHPDTGGTYEWARPLETWKDIPLIQLKTPATVDRQEPAIQDFKAVDVDLVSSELPDSTVDLIMSGEGCTDRSAALFTVSIAMIKARFTDDEILSVLTDKENYLGQAAYEHANTTSRKRAAQWLRRYTLTKVKAELSAAKTFADSVVVSDETQSEIENYSLGFAPSKKSAAIDPDWQNKIEREGGKPEARPKGTLKNVHLILSNAIGAALFRRNEFALIDHYGCSAPWGGVAGREINDRDLVLIKFWLSSHYRFEPSTNVIMEAMVKISEANKYHPIRDYLNKLEWDGKPRIENWLETYLGARGPRNYLQAVGAKTLTAMVARVYNPGCKYDTVLVLEGPQGCGKSTAVRILADPWFSDAMINIGDKDAVLAMRLAWVMELGELSSMRKADIDQLKQFISQPTDRIRVPYGKLTETFPRQSIFIGTTNSSEYLKDTTGNRRFWPVKVTQCDFDALTKNRNQLLAEAKVAYEMGESLHLGEEIEEMATREQSKRVFVDEWVNIVGEFLSKKHENFPTNRFTLADIFSDFGPLHTSNLTRADQMRAAECLRLLGYSKKRGRMGHGFATYWGKWEE